MEKIGIISFAQALALPLCLSLALSAHADTAPINPNQVPQLRTEIITIFVHGVIGTRLAASFYNLFNLVRDKAGDTVYAKTVEGIRHDPFFLQNQPIAQIGLQKLDIKDLAAGNAAVCAACLYDALDDCAARGTCSPSEKTMKSMGKHSYYAYGWSGLLSKQTREAEAEEFLIELEKLSAESRARNYVPHIKLVGFSHGGNLCAQLAHAKQKLEQQPTIKVDELILIGTPILKETKIVLEDPLFERVYNIYSLADAVQGMEVFSGELFSGKKFETTKNAPLPQKLTQIEIHVHKDRIKKNRYTKKEKNFGSSDYSPGHMELWFFGWTPNHYREDYPLYPLPTMVFTPYIINRVNELGHSDPCPVVVTLHPEQNMMKIGNVKTDFLNASLLKSLKQTTLEHAPEKYSIAEYRAHCKEAYWNAREGINPLPARR